MRRVAAWMDDAVADEVRHWASAETRSVSFIVGRLVVAALTERKRGEGAEDAHVQAVTE